MWYNGHSVAKKKQNKKNKENIVPKLKNENYRGKTEKIVIYVEKDLDTRIRQVADENGMYISEVVRQSIIAGLEKFFVESQGSFLTEKIKEAVEDIISQQMDALRKELEKRIIGLLSIATNHTLQTESLTKDVLDILIKFNNANISNLSNEKIADISNQFLELFKKKALSYMRATYQKNKEKKESLELSEEAI